MDVEDISAFESREIKLKICSVCVEMMGLEEAVENQPWICSRCSTPLVGEIMHFQRCYPDDQCSYEHMHHKCYADMVSELIELPQEPYDA